MNARQWTVVLVAGFAAGVLLGWAGCGGATAGSQSTPDASTGSSGLDGSFNDLVPGVDGGVVDDASADSMVDAQIDAMPMQSTCGACEPAFCPAALPDAGSPCVGGDYSCEYAKDSGSPCSSLANCEPDAGWLIHSPPDGACDSTLPAGCPSTFAVALGEVGTPCDAPLACGYPEGTCGCPIFAPTDAGPSAWACAYPPEDGGCPVERPRIGTACDGPLFCPYGEVCTELAGPMVICCCGMWDSAGTPPCPPP